MATNLLKCGCAICQGSTECQDSLRAQLKNDVALLGTNVSALANRGTASEVLIDGTPTNGANPFVDSLVWGGRWQSSGTKTTIAYSFVSNTGTYPWSTESKSAIEKALLAWENVANIDFVATSNPAKADCVFYLLTNDQSEGSLGWSEIPAYSTGEPLFTAFNAEAQSWSKTGLAIGGLGYVTAIHEFGHLLGLAHPHDGGDASDGNIFPNVTSAFGDFGDFDLNQGIYTTMSYNDGWKTKFPSHSDSLGFGLQGTPMALDTNGIVREARGLTSRT